MKIPPLPPKSAKLAGKKDKIGRWYPNDDLLSIPGAFAVRSPSKAFPFSYINHYLTNKFARLLALHNPKLYFELSGVDQNSETGKYIVAEYAKKRILK